MLPAWARVQKSPYRRRLIWGCRHLGPQEGVWNQDECRVQGSMTQTAGWSPWVGVKWLQQACCAVCVWVLLGWSGETLGFQVYLRFTWTPKVCKLSSFCYVVEALAHYLTFRFRVLGGTKTGSFDFRITVCLVLSTKAFTLNSLNPTHTPLACMFHF